MRGFRGNRATQNVMAFRYGQSQSSYPAQNSRFTPHPQSGSQGGQNRPPLPEWLKTPETKAREAEALRQASQPIAQAKAQRPELKVIQGGQAQAKAEPKGQPKATKSATKRKTVRASSGTKAAEPKRAAKKRVAAPARRKAS